MVVLAAAATSQTRPAQNGADVGKAKSGSEACASCHAEIYNSYQKTVMARASGRAEEGLMTGEFRHKPSGVDYRVYQQDGRVWMSYERSGGRALRGQNELQYFIGSGVKGRTYLFPVDGFWFEAPINWYSQEHRWNMTPAYTEAEEVPMNLPAFSSCLNCHTSGMQTPADGTENKFAGALFLHGGITCQRCHGEEHAGENSQASANSIVNPASMPPERRDSICMECHFEGTVAVEQRGKHVYDFQPGERLSDYVHYFLLESGGGQARPEALSQFEALSLSACKRASGDKMWCGSCHDPHREPAADEKAAYYRGKCLNCHGAAFGEKHHPDRPDCRQCHMPALPSQDVAHTEATDHRILRYPKGPQLEDLPSAPKLVAFPGSAASAVTTRDLALAWETLAQRGVAGAGEQAKEYLDKAVKENPDDALVLSALGYIEQERGHEREAKEFYERALKVSPLDGDAATDLGAIEARSGNLRRAVELWQGAFARAPYRSAIGMNLAMAFCAAGQRDDARRYVNRVLEFNPDLQKARQLLKHLDGDPPHCKP